MAVSDDLKFKMIIAGVGVLAVAYAAKKVGSAGQSAVDAVSNALGSAYDTAAGAVGEGFTFVSNLPATAWNTAQAPQTQLGPFNSTATSIVNAPSNLLDATSMGMIGGSGGANGNGGIGAWLWGIVDGSAFKPAGQP